MKKKKLKRSTKIRKKCSRYLNEKKTHKLDHYPLDVTTRRAHPCQTFRAVFEPRNDAFADDGCPSTSNISTANLRNVKKKQDRKLSMAMTSQTYILEIRKMCDRMTN